MILSLNAVTPEVADGVYISENAAVIGRVKIMHGASVWFGASIRGDVDEIIIGENSNVQDNASLHTSEGMPLILGRGVTVGHNAVLHSCEIGDDSLIGMGAIVLDGAKIGRGCIIGAGALVTGGKVIPDGSLVLGSPAKVVRELTDAEINSNIKNAEEYIHLSSLYLK